MTRVRATQQGFYGHFREIGDEFDIEGKEAFSENWMVKVKAGKAPASEEPEDELSGLDKEALISFGKANCKGLKLTRAMNEDTLRARIRQNREG